VTGTDLGNKLGSQKPGAYGVYRDSSNKIDGDTIEGQMPVTTILIGLPGSGKTTFLSNHFEHFPDESFDDFHGGSLDGTGAFKQSRYYEALKRRLQEGKDCLISDIEYCRRERLTAAEEGLRGLSLDLGIPIEIKRLYFENNPNACRHNVVHRFDKQRTRDYLDELKKIDAMSAVYDCPAEGALTVGTCCDSDKRIANGTMR
jgi:GTPase SAR1 family protein